MSSKMLIDASHPEETRVVVVRGNRIEEFDFESEHKKQIRGNIYLARVTRVEPSLQAAFVEYGGNRHGFLAFSEIHPDYYQIPFADRQALLEAEAAEHHDDDDEDEPRQNRRDRKDRGRRSDSRAKTSESEESLEGGVTEVGSEEDDAVETFDGGAEDGNASVMEMAIEPDEISEEAGTDGDSNEESASGSDEATRKRGRRRRTRKPSGEDKRAAKGETSNEGNDESADSSSDDGHAADEQEVIESVGAEDAMEEAHSRRRVSRRQYKIQEVIKRRQVLLVQVVKEERGNKGAALTTYLSLAGRYSVLMPNTGRGGGISRKITNIQDRKRLKDVVKELEVPKGMGVILRTAGANRTKVEIKRDYEYLMRAWENVRTLTLQSSAPALVYEEGSLIKRSIRDLYNKDIGEIMVAGEAGYREAKDFMRMLMPSHAKMVQPHRDPTPLFARAGIESQLDRMLQPQVTLKSGGYIIINQTEALVSIDVNSGRSTREHSIEDTALQTNLEAAEEVARQLRLRDLAGLVVIDFIDMDENRNNRAVEKRLKDHLKNDRARIQVGRISHFGLLEMSRQRIRASVLESTMQVCAHCGGTGHVRSQSSVALHVIRTIEENLQRSASHDLIAKTSVATALYVLNHKRAILSDLEARYGLNISIEADEKVGQQHVLIERGEPATGTPRGPLHPVVDTSEDDAVDEELARTAEAETEVEAEDRIESPLETSERAQTSPQRETKAEGEQRRKRRRRRRGRNRNGESDGEQRPAGFDQNGNPQAQSEDGEEANLSSDDEGETAVEEIVEVIAADVPAPDVSSSEPTKAKPRGRRKKADTAESADAPSTAAAAEKPKARARRKKADTQEAEVTPEAVSAKPVEAPQIEPVQIDTPAAPATRRSNRRTASAEAVTEPVITTAASANEVEQPAEPAPRKGGWWQKKGFF